MKKIYLLFAIMSVLLTSLNAQVTFRSPDGDSYKESIFVSAEIQKSPAQVTLKWPAIFSQGSISNIIIYRRESKDAAWTQLASIAGSSLQYVDNTIQVNKRYEYRLNTEDYLQTGETHFHTEGAVEVCIDCEEVTNYGKVLLVIENSVKSAIQAELDTFKTDLIGSGWQVLETTVNSSDAVTSVKSTITDFYNNQNIRAAILIGHVPVPYSGLIYPDGHSDHRGAWPADVYYAEINGTNWTDATVNYTGTSDRITNVPGDGKFDQSGLSSEPEIELGRIDFSGYTTSAADLDEVGMLKRYFHKNHRFRTSKLNHGKRVLVADHFPGINVAGTAMRDMSTFFGPDSVKYLTRESPANENAFVDGANEKSYLWGYGCGAGTPFRAATVGTTDDFFNTKTNVVFMSTFGSYFGDWEGTNNFLRAPLASQSDALVNFWSGRTKWKIHPMATGQTIGYCTKLSQGIVDDVDYEVFSERDNISQFSFFLRNRGTHLALMGDPTLTMLPVGKPTDMTLTEISPGIVKADWTASNDASILGYNVYRANTIKGTYAKLNADPITGTEYTDFSPTFGNNVYFVRAIKLEETGSGSFYNLSVAEYDSISASTALPTYALTVNDGSGSGDYPDGFTVDISANDSIFDQQFVAWTGDVAGVADVNSATTTFTTSASAKTITATYTAVDVPVTNVSIDQISLTIEEGLSSTLTAVTSPDEVTDASVTWSSANTAIATVNPTTGEVTGVSAGTVDIIVTANSDTDVKDMLNVTVIPPVLETTLNTIDDAFVYYSGDVNNNDKAYVEVRNSGEYSRTGFLKFDLGSIERTISSVKLRLYTVYDPKGNSSASVYRLDNDNWSETTVTANNQPTGTETLGGVIPVTLNAWTEVDITSLATGMSDDILTLKLVGSNPNFIRFETKEGTNKPELIVETEVGGSNIPATSVAIDQSSVSVQVGSSSTLSATVNPNNATDGTVSWTSLSPSVATVNASTGEVTGVAVGTATIRATANGGTNITDEITVTVTPIPATSIAINESSLTVEEGASGTLSATVNPNNATDGTVNWTSLSTSIATVSSTGEVTGVSAGTVGIVATANGGTNVSDTLLVTVSSSNTGGGDVTTLTTIDDSYVVTGSTENNYSQYNFIEVRDAGETYSREAYLKFDLSAISGTINNVKLRLYTKYDDQKKGTSVVQVYRIDNDAWSEYTLTPTNAPTGVETTGGTMTVAPSSWNEVDVTDLVTGMGDDILTLKLVGVTAINLVRFDTKEATNQPELVVETGAPSTIPATSITINESSLTLEEGASGTLSATVNPNDATDGSITWSSANASIATVNASTGEVTGVSAGTVNITAVANGGTNVDDVLQITVTAPSTGGGDVTTLTTIDDSYVVTGSTENNYSQYNFIEVRDAGSTYSREAYLKFDLSAISGTINNVKLRLYTKYDDQKKGTSVVQVYRIDNDAWSESTLTPTNAPTGVETTGGTMTVAPSSWNEVDVTDLVTGMGDDILTLKLVGVTAINLVRFDTKEATNQPELVVETGAPSTIPATSIAINESSLTVEEGASGTLSATVNPNNATDGTVSWTSLDASIATVSSSTGEVTGVSAGTVGIVATANGGTNVSDTLLVTVSSSNTGGGDVTTLTTIDDSYVVTGSPANNYSQYNFIEVRDAGETYSREAYLKFDLSAISGTINDVKLRLYTKFDDQKKGTSLVQVSRIDNDAWTESTLVPTNAPTGVETTGGTMTVAPSSWNEVDVTDLVTGMGDNVLTLKLVGLTAVNMIRFDTKEATNQPELVVSTAVMGRRGIELGNTSTTDVSVHPNPTSTGNITVDGIVANEDAVITILDLSGNAVYNEEVYAESNSLELNIESLTEGLYFLYIQQGSSQVVTKIIKE